MRGDIRGTPHAGDAHEATRGHLADAAQRSAWSRNALAFAETADLYSMPQKAADVILGESA